MLIIMTPQLITLIKTKLQVKIKGQFKAICKKTLLVTFDLNCTDRGEFLHLGTASSCRMSFSCERLSDIVHSVVPWIQAHVSIFNLRVKDVNYCGR